MSRDYQFLAHAASFCCVATDPQWPRPLWITCCRNLHPGEPIRLRPLNPRNTIAYRPVAHNDDRMLHQQTRHLLAQPLGGMSTSPLVMGAYSHSRLREMLMGGVMRHVLKNAVARPVLL